MLEAGTLVIAGLDVERADEGAALDPDDVTAKEVRGEIGLTVDDGGLEADSPVAGPEIPIESTEGKPVTITDVGCDGCAGPVKESGGRVTEVGYKQLPLDEPVDDVAEEIDEDDDEVVI